MRREGVRALLAALSLALLGGCFHTDYYVAGTTPMEEVKSEWRHRLILGLIDLDSDVNLREVCPQGVSHIEEEMEVPNVIFSVLSLWIYTPTTIDIRCQQTPPPAPREQPPPAEPAPAPEPPPDVPVVDDPEGVTGPADQDEGTAAEPIQSSF